MDRGIRFSTEMLKAVARLHGWDPDPEDVEEWAYRLNNELEELFLVIEADVQGEIDPAQPRDLWRDDTGPSRAAGSAAAPAAPVADESSPVDGGHSVQEREATDSHVEGEALHALSLASLSRAIRSGDVSPTEVVEHFLRRIEEHRALNAFISVLAESALQAAHELERRWKQDGPPGPLAGIPVAIKDMMAIEGVVMTGGSRALPNEPSSRDAACVRELRRAGAIIIGTANLNEMARGVTGENAHYGRVVNPRWPDRMAGGSSGGSAAAVAAGLAAGAIGTDTGGSIRIPAACCGVVGFKPSYDLVSRQGVLPLAWSLDHVGPIAKTVKDAEMLVEGLVGRPLSGGSGGESQGDLRGVRVGVPAEYVLDYLDDQVRAAFELSLTKMEELGAEVQEVSIPTLRLARSLQFIILFVESSAAHWRRLVANKDGYGRDVRINLEVGIGLSAPLYVHAQRLRAQLSTEMRAVFHTVDVLATPTLAGLPPRVGQREGNLGGRKFPITHVLNRLTSPFNLTGLPALTLPCAVTPGGLPVSLQIVGRHGRDRYVLHVGHVYETSALVPFSTGAAAG